MSRNSEPYRMINLFDWRGGIQNRLSNPLAFPENALTGGENVEIDCNCLRTRSGISVASYGSLPSGEVVALQQTRFPSNETSYLLAQVRASGVVYKPISQITEAGPRYYFYSAYDSASNYIWVFGGLADPGHGPFLNDLWYYDCDADKWTQVTESINYPPWSSWEGDMVYDPSAHRLILYVPSAYTLPDMTFYKGDFWVAYDIEGNSWEELEVTGAAFYSDTRGRVRMIYREISHSIILTGGNTVEIEFPVQHYTVLNLSTMELSGVECESPDGEVQSRNSHAMAYDPVTDKIVVVGGQTIYGGYSLRDAWELDIGLSLWRKLPDIPCLGDDMVTDSTVVACSGTYYVLGSSSCSNEEALLSDVCWKYTGRDTWETVDIADAPPGRAYAKAFVADQDVLLILGAGYPLWASNPINGAERLVDMCAPVEEDPSPQGDTYTVAPSKLYASPTHLPTDQAEFTEIYNLGRAGYCSFAVLNDRLVIAADGMVPLVWGGCMSSEASDWMYPKAVLVSQDGTNYYDVSAEVCDKDTDNEANIGNIRASGFLAVCTDMPTVEGFYFEMGTPNSAAVGTSDARTFTAAISYSDDSTNLREDLKGEIVAWVQDSDSLGHFEGVEIDLDESPVVDKGGGLVGIPCTGQPYVADDSIRISGTSNYNGTFDVDISSTANEIVVAASYAAETLTSTAKSQKRLTLGPGYDCPDVEKGLSIAFGSTNLIIENITGAGSADSAVTLSLGHASADVDGIYGIKVANGSVTGTFDASPASSLFSYSVSHSERQLAGYSARCVIRSAQLASDASVIRIQLKAGTYFTGTSDTGDFSSLCNATITHVSIVERSSEANGATTPTEITFDDGQSGCVLEPGEEKWSDLIHFTIDKTGGKDYLVIVDLAYGEVTLTVDEKLVGISATTYQTVQKTYRQGVLALPTLGGNYQNLYLKVGEGKSSEESWNLQNVSGYKPILGDNSIIITGMEKAAFYAMPSGSFVGATSGNGCNIFAADDFQSLEAICTTPGSSSAYFAVSLDGKQTFQAFEDVEWKTIVKSVSSTWQYLDASGTWQDADQNTMLHALRQALSIASNRMTANQLKAITSSQWKSSGGIDLHITSTIDVGYLIHGAGVSDSPKIAGFQAKYNDYGSTAVECFKEGAWTSGAGWADSTIKDDVPWGQSGTIMYQGGSITADYAVVNEVPGYWFRFKPTGTSPETAVTRVIYKAPCQPLANIGDGQPDTPLGFIYHNVGSNLVRDYTVEVSDNALTALSKADLPMGPSDRLYLGYLTPFDECEITPYDLNNTNASVLSAEYWNGEAWSALAITDGTKGTNRKTFSAKGRVSWKAPQDWRMSIPLESHFPRGYWIRFKVSASLSAGAAISEVRIYGVPQPIAKHSHAVSFRDRIALVGRPDAPDQVDVSRALEEYGFIGKDSGSYRVGGTDSIHCAVSAWNGLFLGKTETWHQLTGGNPDEFAFQGVEAARHVPVNSRVIVKAPMAGTEASTRYGLFFLNRFGAFVSTGLHTDTAWNTGRTGLLSDSIGWWDDSLVPRLALDSLHQAVGEYWPAKNWIIWSVPMITDAGQTSQRTNNRLIIFDMALGAWLPPFTISLASLTLAYHYCSRAPGKLGPIGLYGGDYQGRIIRLFSAEDTTDFGEPISGWIETGWLHMGSPEWVKLIRNFQIYGQTSQGREIPVKIWIDGNTDVSWPDHSISLSDLDIVSGSLFCREQVSLNLQGRFFKFRMEFMDIAQIFGIQIGTSLIREWGAM